MADERGIAKDRGCTDIICLLLFVALIGFTVILAIFGVWFGRPELLLKPVDSNGNPCGATGSGLEKKPYLYFFDLLVCTTKFQQSLIAGCPTPQVCIESCPHQDHSWIWVVAEGIELDYRNANNLQAGQQLPPDIIRNTRAPMICKYGVNPNDTVKYPYIRDLVYLKQLCAPYVLPMESVMHRCVPNLAADGFRTLFNQDKKPQDANGKNITSGRIKQAAYVMKKFQAGLHFFETAYRDVVTGWWAILMFFGIALILSLVWLLLMRYCAGVMVWVTILAFLSIFLVATGFAWFKYFSLMSQTVAGSDAVADDSDVDFDDKQSLIKFALTGTIDYYASMQKTWLILGIVLGSILLVVFIILIFLYQRIRIGVQLVKEAASATMVMIEVIFFPVLTFLLQFIVFVACVGVGMCLMSLQRAEKASMNGTITFNISDKVGLMHCDDAQEGNSTFEDLKRKFCSPTIPYGWLKYFQFFVLFMYFWLFNFIMGLSQMAIAGCYVDWYFTRDKSIRLPGRTLLSAVWRTLRYHTGSVAFGSLIIAIVQIARAILDYIDEQFSASRSDLAQFIMKCCKCCLWCLEKVLKFITKNAYIMVAIRGKNFCWSAREAFFLLTRNIIRVVVLSNISSFLMFIGKLFIVGVTVVLAFFLIEKGVSLESLPSGIQSAMSNNTNHSAIVDMLLPNALFKGNIHIDLSNPHFWLAVIVIGTFVIAACFFTVFEMGVDTLFLCFCEDLEMNDGSAERPYFMTKGLMEILDKRNAHAAPKPEEKKEGGEEAVELKKIDT